MRTMRAGIFNRRRAAGMLCVLLLIAYASLSISAVAGKSPTYDEPLHELASYMAWHGDFRLEFDHPPLWKYWVALPNASEKLPQGPINLWQKIPSYQPNQYPYMMHVLYGESANGQVDRMIFRSRVMMALLAALFGGVIAIWSWRLGGSVAAIAATFLFAFDPNFLAHGPLVKNDVVLALLMAALGLAIYQFGQRPRWSRILISGLICGAACACKLSGVVLPIAAILLLILRALLANKSLGSRSLLSAAVASLIVAITTVLVIWAAYGFRFAAATDPRATLDLSRALTAWPTNQATPLFYPVGNWMLAHRLLPEAWLNGLILLSIESARRPSFLLGQFSDTGWRMFYPIAIAVKTPIATLTAIALACVVLIRRCRQSNLWASACLIVPPMVYALAALATPATVGLRHLLPIYPYLFIGCGIAARAAWNTRATRWITGILAAALLLESLGAYPNYIPFFNYLAGGNRGGLSLLSDSNLDWGQDLPLLANWQRGHPDEKLYLCYFGTADPGRYGIHYTNLPGGDVFGGPPQELNSPGVIAISATNLQGVFYDQQMRQYYQPLHQIKPIQVLGGSIYLFRFP